MGFWHTGYMEFHEQEYEVQEWSEPRPIEYACAHCDSVFQEKEELRYHRFAAHPLQRPVMFLNGFEVGATAIKITTPLSESDISVDNCECATVDGIKVEVSKLPGELVSLTSGICQIVLAKGGIQAEFQLDYQVALEKDLEGIEKEFLSVADTANLNLTTIESFISHTSRFRSAISYSDGICEYLYGILAKERSPDTNLDYDDYIKKFSIAAQKLGGYERPLAKSIGSLIEFHFNHFVEARTLSPQSRAGIIANRFDCWLKAKEAPELAAALKKERSSGIEKLLTDLETEQILRWTTKSLKELASSTETITEYLKKGLADYDRKKLQVLLAEVHVANDEPEKALLIAKGLRNVPFLEHWAESLISRGAE